MRRVLAAETERAQSAIEMNQDEPIQDLATASQQLQKPDWDRINTVSANTHLNERNNALTSFIQPPPPGCIEE